jgi:hypothetical protein
MNITEAIRAISDEYDAEAVRARTDRAFDALSKDCLRKEYGEIDQELPGYVADIARAMGVPQGTELPHYVYQTARMCFRLGMRTQRKIDRPDQATSLFWRSDEVKI